MAGQEHMDKDVAAQAAGRYIAIDLKSFYASVECVERGLDPLDACLAVADTGRTDRTICLAVSPALKSFGVGGRPRLFELERRLREVNRSRGCGGTSVSGKELAENGGLAVGYIAATPRMSLYLRYSTRIYGIYLRFVAPEDIHVYSVDEVFIDAGPYLRMYGMSARQLAARITRAVLAETGITATAGIGTNLYLSKVAMDIVAKRVAGSDGVRIAELDEMSYRRELWGHEPLTDFWRIGPGLARRLEGYGMRTMGDIARCSLRHPAFFYKAFGVNAELIIDHAWGHEPVTMDYVKAYRPGSRSLSAGQVLSGPYTAEKARTVVLEMADTLSLSMVDAGLACGRLVLSVGYDVTSLRDASVRGRYSGTVGRDRYGREVPARAHGSVSFPSPTSSADTMMEAIGNLFDSTVNADLLVRRINVCAAHVVPEPAVAADGIPLQLELFTDYAEMQRRWHARHDALQKERRRQEAVLRIKKKYGKNSILRGLNFADGATQRERNAQIGGHKA